MFERLRSSIVFKCTRQLIIRYKEADLPAMSAQITYYLILAFFPFLLFLINMLSFTPLSSKLLIINFNTFLPNDTAILIKNMLIHTVQAKSKILLLLGIIGSLWVASRGISAIIRGLNNSYSVEESRKFIKLNFTVFISTIGICVMIVLAFIMLVFGEIIGSYVFGLIRAQNLFSVIWSFLRYGISFTLMLITFYLIYRYVPNKKLKFHNIIIGAIFTTVGLIITSLLFSFYVNNFANYEKIYGSLGGVIALISWLYINTLIILLGAELNAISSNFENKER